MAPLVRNDGVHIPGGSGGLIAAREMTIGPDGNLYISNFFDNSILRYDGNTGTFIDAFVASDSAGLVSPRDSVFGPDANFFVGNGGNEGQVHRFDGRNGAFIDVFVRQSSGDLNNPVGLLFIELDAILLPTGGTSLLLGETGFSSVIHVPFTGPGGIEVADASTVVFESNNSYAGETIVGSGTLLVNGSLFGTTRLLGGGRLGGTGSLGNVTVQSGVLAPANSIGTMTVNGNLDLSANAALEVEVNASGASDLIVVNGTVNLDSPTLNVRAESGNYQVSTDYIIVDNDDTDPVTGQFGQINTNFLFLSPMVSTVGGDGNDVVLTLLRNDLLFSAAAKNRNQSAVAQALANEAALNGFGAGSLPLARDGRF